MLSVINLDVFMKKLTKTVLSKAGKDLGNKHTREKRETEAAKELAKARWKKAKK